MIKTETAFGSLFRHCVSASKCSLVFFCFRWARSVRVCFDERPLVVIAILCMHFLRSEKLATLYLCSIETEDRTEPDEFNNHGQRRSFYMEWTVERTSPTTNIYAYTVFVLIVNT